MALFDREWFTATMFGKAYTALTAEEYDFAFTMAEHELRNVACWCPKLYPQALAIKVSLILQGSGLVGDTPVSLEVVGGEHVAIVQQDEVFDTRRQYKIVARDKQAASSSPAGLLASIIASCKPVLSIGAFAARGTRNVVGDECCTEVGKALYGHGDEQSYS